MLQFYANQEILRGFTQCHSTIIFGEIFLS